MKSLRSRAVAGGAVWATIVALAGTSAVGNYLDRLTLSRFDEFLTARHAQVVVALANSHGEAEAMPRQIGDPVYQRPFSGNYWQVESDDGRILVSRSMADSLLPTMPSASTDVTVQNVAGPASQELRVLAQEVTLDDGAVWLVRVASSTQTIDADQAELRRRLNISFAFVGVLAIAGALLIVWFTLRPLSQLRRDVIDRETYEGELPVDDYPLEVRPLVTEINNLLDRNRDIVDRSRRQTADLAHAIKTPSSVLRNELFELQLGGVSVQSGINALDRLDAQLNRSFARMKASQDGASEKETTSLDICLARLGRAFTALAKNKDRDVILDAPPDLHAKINQIDFEEILGNLLDNALKWSRSAIGLSVSSSDDWVHFSVEDDGDGIAAHAEKRALISGQRLDETKPGTGLGLAIASDLVAAYQGTIDVGRSEAMGGARIVVNLPRAH
ncbi:ATP-binding protein [Loktanella sp. Alg231-35]|uniref:ATP-binding protein n=1 Tax=Loktanella sp. Alg231-35 TaxID=1922220 RepID=UPI000D55432F|nr:HAMP domain-containing sensor histidine kinase [Loktanella sp. Alg231-35]